MRRRVVGAAYQCLVLDMISGATFRDRFFSYKSQEPTSLWIKHVGVESMLTAESLGMNFLDTLRCSSVASQRYDWP